MKRLQKLLAPIAATLRAMAIPLAAFGMGAMALGSIGATPAAAQSGKNYVTEVPQGDWPEFTYFRGEKWTIARVPVGCYAASTDFDPPVEDKAILLAAPQNNPFGQVDGLIFLDPSLRTMASDEPIMGGTITLNGAPFQFIGAMIKAGVIGNMAIITFNRNQSAIFTGDAPIEARFTHKGVTVSDIIDATPKDLAVWRQCIAGMRAAK